MSAMSGLRQTFPPPEGNGGVALLARHPAPAPVAHSSAGSSAEEGPTASEEERSAALSVALVQAGFVPSRVRNHFVLTEVLESMWSNFGFKFGGNFAEGWGYNLYSVSGRPGFDSSVSYKFVHPGHTVHFEDCVCPDRGRLTCRISERTGVLKLSRHAIPILASMGLVSSMDGEVLNPRAHETKQKMILSRCSANPEVLFTEQLACCPHFTRRVLQSLTLPVNGPDTVRITLQPQPFVAASIHGGSRSQQPQQEPTAYPDFCGLERALFQRLTEEQGHLYLLLKYLLLEALPQLLLPDRVKPFTEVHCRQLLWHLLSRCQNQHQHQHLLGRARQGLQLLSELLSAHSGSQTVALSNYFEPRLTVAFAEAAVGSLDRSLLCRILSGSKTLLSERVVDAYVAKLLNRPEGASSHGFVFRPLLMTIPGSSSAGSGPRPLAGISDYPSVGFRLYRALELLLTEGRPSPAAEAEFAGIVAGLRRCAATAAACLRALMTLKTNQGAGMAHQALLEYGGQMSVTDSFELSGLTPGQVSGALLKTDCAWLYRCKLTKDEIEPHNVDCHSPSGTAFLAGYPLIRFLFFPARPRPILHSERCCFEYRLRINFVALWRALRAQLSRDWGSCVLPAGGGPLMSAIGGVGGSLELVDPQELISQVLVCNPSPTRGQLLETFKALVVSAEPFHRDRSRSEWRWVHLVRLHSMGAWLDELRPVATATGTAAVWTAAQRVSCCELIDWCGRYEQLFQCVPSGCGVSAMLHSAAGASSEMQARSMLQSMLETEMQNAFPLTPESGCERDLLVMQLYAKHWSERRTRVQCEKRAKILATH